MTDVHVPDVPGPKADLCWKQDAIELTRCDRRAGHLGPHSWQVRPLVELAYREGRTDERVKDARPDLTWETSIAKQKMEGWGSA